MVRPQRIDLGYCSSNQGGRATHKGKGGEAFWVPVVVWGPAAMPAIIMFVLNILTDILTIT